MLTGLEDGLGLDVVIWLQEHSNSVFDLIAQILDTFGTSLFYMIFIPMFYWSIDKKLGRRLLFALLLASATSVLLKIIFKTPRPYIAHPDKVKHLAEAESFGIPSGHTTNATVIGLVLAMWFKKRWFSAFAVFYVLLMGLSRMLAGVHYPQDIVAGILLGVGVVFLIDKITDRLSLLWLPLSLYNKIGIVFILSAVLVFILWDYEDGVKVAAVLAGGGLGMILDDYAVHFDVFGTQQNRIIRYIVGMAIVLLIFFSLRLLFGTTDPESLFILIRYGVVGFVIAYCLPWAFIRFQMDDLPSS